MRNVLPGVRFKQCREVWLTNLYKSDDCEKGIQSLLKATKSRNKKLHKKLKAMFGDIDVLAKVYEKTTNDWVSQFPAQAKSVTISPEGKCCLEISCNCPPLSTTR